MVSSSGRHYTRNGWEYINGHWYYFDQSGWMVTGWLKLGNTWYYSPAPVLWQPDGSISAVPGTI
ncbi:MAG: hypothetical protein ACLT1I_12670 [Mediterraneibacter faecis]